MCVGAGGPMDAESAAESSGEIGVNDAMQSVGGLQVPSSGPGAAGASDARSVFVAGVAGVVLEVV